MSSAAEAIQNIINITDRIVNCVGVLKKSNSDMAKRISSLESRIRSLEYTRNPSLQEDE